VTRQAGEQAEQTLVETARAGDVESFGELYRRYYASMVGVARAVLGDPHLAEDAAQETFAIACRDLGRLRRTEKFARWLRGICRNVAREFARKRGPLVQPHHVASLSGDSQGDGAAADVRTAVSRLGESAREVLLLRYFSGLSHEQIAAGLGISPQAVHGRLTRARRKLADDLRRNGWGRRES